MSRPISRRLLASSSLSAAAAAYVGGAGNDRLALAQTDATPTAAQGVEAVIGEASVPAWRFAVTLFEDPYRGTVDRPTEPPPNSRYIGAEVVIMNDSDQPLEFRTTNIRLRDLRGFQYAAGDVTGTEPRLVSQNLPDAERSRGWVWFVVPSDAEPSELTFEGPPPVLRVGLTE